MPRLTPPLYPRTRDRAIALGDRLRLARRRRRITLDDLAARVGTTRVTLGRLEHGDLSVSLALLVRVLGALGLEEDIDRLAANDEIGRRLQDARTPRPRTVRSDRNADA